MSLRSDIHSAYDEVAPSTFGLPERVVQTVLTEIPIRHGREGLMFRLRAPMSLVAVFLLIAMVAAVLVGGRLIQDWNASHNPAPAGSNESVLTQLEARPLHLPNLKASDACPDGPEANNLYGDGPVYGIGGWSHPASTDELTGFVSTTWGTYYFQTYLTDVHQIGPILGRARDLRTNQPIVFVGNYAAGPVVGRDTVDGKLVQRHLDVLLDTSGQPSKSANGRQFEWPVIVGLIDGRSDCVGWQFDGPGFTEVWVVYVLPNP